MKRSELEKHLGKQVEITKFYGDVVKGELHKTGEETFKHESDFLHPRNYYFVIDVETTHTRDFSHELVATYVK